MRLKLHQDHGKLAELLAVPAKHRGRSCAGKSRTDLVD